MSKCDARFAGSIPDLYDRYLRALLFEPYAIELGRRASAINPSEILETAAGTGIATEALHQAVPDAAIRATDLNGPMLDAAALRVRSDKITFQVADAQDLPFSDETFDLVACQFGVMFYPDKVKANSEARRVLRPGGRYLAVIWDVIERNPASKIAMDTVAKLFPENPPSFFYRVPHGYADPGQIKSHLVAAGFATVELETVEMRSLSRAGLQAENPRACPADNCLRRIPSGPHVTSWIATATALIVSSACAAPASNGARHVVTYRCSDERTFSVEQSEQSARVNYRNEHFVLPRRSSGIGIRYASQQATLIIDGDTAVLVAKQILDLQSCRALQA